MKEKRALEKSDATCFLGMIRICIVIWHGAPPAGTARETET